MLTAAEKSIVSGRDNTIDYTRLAELQYLGNYLRRLPVSMARMMENALDWEHLAYVHSSSFSSIALVDEGRWGWRAKAALAANTQDTQLLELLLDNSKHYWATSVLLGPAANVEIHTQATSISEREIEIDVNFYSASVLPPETARVYCDVLQQQYAQLYDEDVALMSGRQQALDSNRIWRANAKENEPSAILVGKLASLPKTEPILVETPTGRYCVRFLDGDWVVHSAVCSHLLGPLHTGQLAPDGSIACPWHGYRFDVRTGENLDNKCRALATPPALIESQGELYLNVECNAAKQSS